MQLISNPWNVPQPVYRVGLKKKKGALKKDRWLFQLGDSDIYSDVKCMHKTKLH